MKVEKLLWNKEHGWEQKPSLKDASLVIYFGGKEILSSPSSHQELKQFYPNAQVLGCSTGGEIYGSDVFDDSLVVAAIRFNKTELQTANVTIDSNRNSFDAGKALAKQLQRADLRHIFLLSDGINVNGSELVKGIYDVVNENVIVTGGLAGDGANFKTTLVGLNQVPDQKQIGAIGFYGNALRVHYGSVGGWDPFGPERTITKSSDNILYELDGKPALDLYKAYLGDDAKGLPGSALLFPLSIRPTHDSTHDIVRTIVGINEEEKSLIFAGDIPQGYVAQLMRGNFNHLVEGATKAASLAVKEDFNDNSLAILVSCIGRKLLLGQNIVDETEAVAEVLGNKVSTIGFYSYGEICHQQFTNKCSLHNQTMTVTVLSEEK